MIRLADLTTEELLAMRRAYQEPSQQPVLQSQKGESGPLANLSVEQLMQMRQQALAQQPQQQVPPAPDVPRETNIGRFIGEQLSKGVIGLADIAHLFREHEPMDPMMSREERMAHLGMSKPPSEFVPEFLKNEAGIDINSEPVDTPLKRMASEGLQWAATAPLSGARTVGALAKGALKLGAMGFGSGAAQEAGVNPLVANVGAALAPWAAGRAIKAVLPMEKEAAVGTYLRKSMGKPQVEKALENISNRPKYPQTGYEPLAAEVANDPTLAQIHRAQQGVGGTGIGEAQGMQTDKLRQALQEAAGDEGVGVTRAQQYAAQRRQALEGNVRRSIEDMGEPMTPEQAGRTLQTELKGELNTRRSARRTETRPFYDALSKSEKPLNPQHLKDFLETEVVKGDLAKDKKYIRNLLSSESGQFVDGKQGAIPTVGELSASRQAINSRLSKYERSGEEARAVFMRKAKEALDADLGSIGTQKKADKLYAELSEPVNRIKQHAVLGKAVRQRQKQFTLTESKVPETLIHKGASSVDTAKALKNELGHNKMANEAIKGHLHRLAAESITDINGQVVPAKLASFEKNYPGAKVLYPELFEVKLKNSANAQMLSNRFLKETEALQKTLYKDALGNYMSGQDTQKVMRRVFSGNSEENVRAIQSSLKESPEALEGFRQGAVEHILKNIQNAGAEGSGATLSHAKLQRLMQHEKPLKALLTSDQFKILKETESALKGRSASSSLGSSVNSHTAANARNAFNFYSASSLPKKAILYSLEKMGASAPMFSEFFKDLAFKRAQELESVLNKALVDPNYAAHLLMKPLESKKSFMDYMKTTGRLTAPSVVQSSSRSDGDVHTD